MRKLLKKPVFVAIDYDEAVLNELTGLKDKIKKINNALASSASRRLRTWNTP